MVNFLQKDDVEKRQVNFLQKLPRAGRRNRECAPKTNNSPKLRSSQNIYIT